MTYLIRRILAVSLSLSLLTQGGDFVAAQNSPAPVSELTVQQVSVSDQIAAQTVSMQQRQNWYEAVDKATKEEVATKEVITAKLKQMEETFNAMSKAQSKKQTKKYNELVDQYKALVDELNGLIIIDLQKEFSELAKKVLAENNVYKLTVLQDNIVQGTISNQDFARAVNALYKNLYEPCKGTQCEIRGASMLTLAIAGKYASSYGKNKDFTNKIVQRISGAAKQNYGGFESDKTIGENIIPALAIIQSPTGMRTAVQSYVDKYGKKRRYQPTDPKDAFLIHLTELVAQYPVVFKTKNSKAYLTPHLLAEWSNSDNYLLKLRGNIEIGRFPQRNKYFSAQTLENVRNYLKGEYCKRDRGTARNRDDLLAQDALALGYFGGMPNHSGAIRAPGDYRCVVRNPNPGEFQFVTNKELSQKIATTVILFVIPPGCVLAAVAKPCRVFIHAVKHANKTGKSLKEIYNAGKAMKRAGELSGAAREAQATGQLARQVEGGTSALGKKGAQNVKMTKEVELTQQGSALTQTAAQRGKYTVQIRGTSRTLETSAAEGPAIQKIVDEAADNVARKKSAVSKIRRSMSTPPTAQQTEALAKAEREYRAAVNEQNKVLEGIMNNQSAQEIETSLAQLRATYTPAPKPKIEPPVSAAGKDAGAYQPGSLRTHLITEQTPGEAKTILEELSTALDRAKANKSLTAAQKARVDQAEKYFDSLTPQEVTDLHVWSSPQFRQHAATLRSPQATEHGFFIEQGMYKQNHTFSQIPREEGYISTFVGNERGDLSYKSIQQAFQQAEKTDKPIFVKWVSHGEIDSEGQFYFLLGDPGSTNRVYTKEFVKDLQALRKTTGTPVINLQSDACHSGQFLEEFMALPASQREGINIFVPAGGRIQVNNKGAELLNRTRGGASTIAAQQQTTLLTHMGEDGNIFARAYINGKPFNPLEQAMLRAKAEKSPLYSKLEPLHRMQNAKSVKEGKHILLDYHFDAHGDWRPSFMGDGFDTDCAWAGMEKEIIQYVQDTGKKMIQGKRW